MRKTVDRWRSELVRSDEGFVARRRAWAAGAEVEVFSHGQRVWCDGVVREVLAAETEVLRVAYTKEAKEFGKNLLRWSPDVRGRREVRGAEKGSSEAMSGYQAGDKVMVWSNSRRVWVPGVVVDVLVDHGNTVVSVRYGRLEKKLPVDSKDLKLIDM